MVTITLPPDLEQVLTERAAQQGTTPELFILEELRGRYLPPPSVTATGQIEGKTMADFFAGYAGTINSREIVPEGLHLSKDTGRKFKEIMVQKYRSGKDRC